MLPISIQYIICIALLACSMMNSEAIEIEMFCTQSSVIVFTIYNINSMEFTRTSIAPSQCGVEIRCFVYIVRLKH